ncbi:MAG TPA: serine hydrolase domain-containing protein [Candidatus Rubrimentiphilum sp.]|nr:serine hydrolase domain-containing protein [Candidatus Rubrimentiphilum sp.]
MRYIFTILVLGFVFATLAATPSRQSPRLPDTPAGRTFGAWLAAFNTGDPAKIRAYLRKYHPAAAKASIADELRFQFMTGGFDIRKILASFKTRLKVLIQEHDSDQMAQLDFALQNTPPYHVRELTLEPAQRPADVTIEHLPQSQLIATTQKLITEDVAARRFAGAILIAKRGKVVYAQASGFADRAKRIPNTLNTRFRIGSMNKMFTATAIMQLVQSGKIDLDHSVGTYLPDYPNKTVASSVTIRELLMHTGGTGDIFGPQYEKNRLKLRSLQDYIDLYGKRGPQFKPGSRFAYSNYGFIILGDVIQKVSGEDYYAYVRDHIYLPAGMTSSGSEPEHVAVPNRSVGYTLNDRLQWVPNSNMLGYRGSPAGGGYSTVGDLLKFAQALVAHKFLNTRYTEMMTTGKVAMPGGFKYGFGFGDEMHNGLRCFGHNGGAPGMAGDLKICDDGYTIVTLANVDPPAGRISDFIATRLPLAAARF